MFNQFSLDLLAHISRIREAVSTEFLRLPNVVALGVGFKFEAGRLTLQPSLVISVKRKEPEGQLPGRAVIPRIIDGVITDVIETGPILPFAASRTAPVRPVQPGISIGHPDATAGTLACMVRRGDQWFILSNNHVMALLNTARLGDPILQPGPGDGGTLENAIAELAAFTPVRFLGEPAPNIGVMEPAPTAMGALINGLLRLLGLRRRPAPPVSMPPALPPPENRVDAAIARPLMNVRLDPRIAGIGLPPFGIADPRLGMQVVKSGRTSGVTQGMITQVDVAVDVQYGTRLARYANQIMITPFSQRGDSGALVLTPERQAVGLLFSGSDRISVASPIRFVLAALSVDLVM